MEGFIYRFIDLFGKSHQWQKRKNPHAHIPNKIKAKQASTIPRLVRIPQPASTKQKITNAKQTKKLSSFFSSSSKYYTYYPTSPATTTTITTTLSQGQLFHQPP